MYMCVWRLHECTCVCGGYMTVLVCGGCTCVRSLHDCTCVSVGYMTVHVCVEAT